MTIYRSIDPIEDKFWTYARGELDESAFEAWLYAAPDLEVALGPENYLAVVGCDFRDVSPGRRHDRIETVRHVVTLLFPRNCVCLSMPQSFQAIMSSPACAVATHAKILVRRTPWIELTHCCDCGTHWLIGTDTVDDYFDVHRVSAEAATCIVADDRWPTELDNSVNLWPDIEWLKAFGFDSIDAWRAAKDPSRGSHG